jgi:predicted Fe-Mo cluster-binding NifX family protein
MPYTIAVASSDGQYVDLHFGQTEDFYIFEVDEKTAALTALEKKKANPDSAGCSANCRGNGHETMMARIETVTELLAGCKYLLTAKIGPKPSDLLRRAGVIALESPPDISEAVLKLNTYHRKYGNINQEDAHGK